MVKIAICDDFEDDRLAVSKLITKFFDKNSAVYKIVNFDKCEDIVAEYQDFNSPFDLIFLDVYTNKMNGFEAAQIIRNFDAYVPIIFVTNSVEDAVNGYEVNASGYLIKPVNEEKLIKIIERLNLVNVHKDKEILLKVKTGYHKFKYDEINFIESNRNVVNVHTIDNQVFTIYCKLNDLEMQLNNPRFLRCHQSYLVNMNCVLEAKDSFQMKNGEIVPIRVRGHKEIVDKYYFYFFDNAFDKDE